MMSIGRRRSIVAASLACGAALLHGPAAWAQQPDPVEQSQLPPPAATKKPVAKAAAQGEDSGLRQRVEQLEEQLVDLQVVIGTLESFARSGATSATQHAPVAAGAGGASDQARLDGMETQIRALSAQIQQLSAEMKAQSAGRRSEADPSFSNPAFPDPAFSDPTLPHATAPAPNASRFGSTTVTSSAGDPVAGAANDPLGGAAGPAPGFPAPVATAPPGGSVVAAAPLTEAGNPKQAYENAYGFLLQQDYGAAQSGFSDFLKRYPQDPLAPNALYWLGETHYVQRNYADAAEAFDLVLTAFSSSAKAPDAQLKRAMSLAQLGKKQDACAALQTLGSKFPNAPAHVKAKADTERQRVGCS